MFIYTRRCASKDLFWSLFRRPVSVRMDDDDDECYICLNPCKEVSPCECQSHVHKECLDAYLAMSGHRHCTICRRTYTTPPPRNYTKWVCYVLIGFGAYLFAGYIGQIVFFKLGVLSSLPNGVFWSAAHIFSAWMVISTVGCLYAVYRSCRLCTI